MSVRIDIAPTSTPTAFAPTWTSIGNNVKTLRTRIGRTTQIEQFTSGSMNFTANDPDRRFDPTNGANVLGGTLRPNMQIRAVSIGNSKVLFRGHVDPLRGWFLRTPHGRRDVELAADCRDWLGYCSTNIAEVTTALYDGDLAYQRVTRMLDAVGVDASNRDINAGQVPVVGTKLGLNAASHMQACSLVEGGAMFAQTDGVLTFEQRYQLANKSSTTTISCDDDDDVHVYDHEIGWHPMRNSVSVSDEDGRESFAYDAASITTYGVEGLSLSRLPFARVADRQQTAFWNLQRFKTPIWGPKIVRCRPLRSDDELAAVTGVKLRDRITVVLPVGGTPTSFDCVVEGIEHDIQQGNEWTTTFYLSPFSQYAFIDPSTLLAAGNATSGTLGGTRRIAP